MHVQINIDTREPLSPEDKAILRAIGYMDAPAVAEAPAAATAPTTATPTKKAAASTPKKAAAEPVKQAEPEPTPAPEPAADEDLEEAKDKAVAKASTLLHSGKRDVVMAALESVGVAKVSAIADRETLDAFLAAIS